MNLTVVLGGETGATLVIVSTPYALQRPQTENRDGWAPPSSRSAKRASKRPYPSSAMASPVVVGSSWKSGSGRPERPQGQAFSTILEIGGQFAVTQSDSVVASDTGATATLVCFKWMDSHTSFLRTIGLLKVTPYSAAARLKFGLSEACSGYQSWRCGAKGRRRGVRAGCEYSGCIARGRIGSTGWPT